MIHFRFSMAPLVVLLLCGFAQTGWAQTGVSDDRVSLPGGPGSLEGLGENVGINGQMGQSSHSVSVSVPQGYQGMTPGVRLSYSSGAGAGIAGMGWSMAMPSIERMTSRGLPDYDTEDLFAANGSEHLVRISDGTSAVYRARFEGGFVRYTWHQRGDGSEGYWTAESPSGNVSYYGADRNGTLVPTARVGGDEGTFKYLLVEEVDVWGHRIRYEHRFFGTTSLLTSIGYVFLDDTPRFEVAFDYEDRPDFISDAKPGFAEVIEQRLSSIRVLSGGIQIQRHALTYAEDATAARLSKLVRVERFGAEGGRYPAVFDFEYARSLGGLCEGEGCEMPFLVSMGSLGTNPQNGNVTLVDINGDALPDVLDTTDAGPHRFFLNQWNSAEDHTLVRADDSGIGNGNNHDLSAGSVQVLDVDGDGFADLLNTVTGQVLENKGEGDWTRRYSLFEDSGELPNFENDLDPGDGELASIRFIDIDNDKKIDVLRSLGAGDGNVTQVFINTGAGFRSQDDVQRLALGFDSDRLQLADANGDGLLDAIQIQPGAIQVFINLGRGRWQSGRVIENLPFDESEIPRVELNDLNNDGLADFVLVQGDVVRYALGRSGSFAEVVTIDSDTVGQPLPTRLPETTVLFADMNGNGSTDVVWVDPNGNVTYLEVFPVQPNLLSRVSNNLGAVQTLTYSTTVEQAAAAAFEGTPWTHRVPYPSTVVARLDSYDTHSDVHEITEYRYRDGFHDGVEKQFRGFGIVQSERIGDESVQQGFIHQEFSLGVDDPYRAGLLLFQSIVGDGEPIRDVTFTHEDCPLAGLPDQDTLDFPIRYVCSVREEMLLKDGAPEQDWITTVVERRYDGYGSVARETHHGTTAIGGAGCAPCQRPDGVFGEPCGNQCLGDESTIETEYALPEDNNGRWILGAPVRERRYAQEGGPTAESLTYYDGPDFVGLPLGQLTHGSPTRAVKVVNGEGETIETMRLSKDGHGNRIETITPVGSVGVVDDQRTFQIFDELGLRVKTIDFLLTDPDGEPYRLRQEALYEPIWLKVTETTDFMVYRDGQRLSPRNSEAVLYDEFGRVSEVFAPGDPDDKPSQRMRYHLESPRSRVVIDQRSERGGEFDRQSVRCFDGLGRLYQERTRLESGLWLVDGFKVFNPNGQIRRAYENSMGDDEMCDVAPPEDAAYQDLVYDAAGRLLTDTWRRGDIRRVRRNAYGPGWTLSYDHSDTNPDSPHFDTPTRVETDGLGREIRHLRMASPTEAEAHTFTYDALGNYRGYTDPEGNEKVQTYDLLGRMVQVDDPDRGTLTYTYDAAGHILSQTDGRGVTTAFETDTMGRGRAVWDVADPEGTRTDYRFDFPEDCPEDRCRFAAGRLVEIGYPLGDGARGEDWYGYNEGGAVTNRTRNVLGRRFDFGWTYDNLDRLLARHYPDGRTVDLRRDDGGRLKAIPGVIDAVTYDETSRVRRIGLASGAAETFDYDGLYRVEHHGVETATGAMAVDLTYTYDAAGNPTEIVDNATDSGAPSLSARYTYDAFHRLTSARLDPGQGEFEERLVWRYDALGNILSKTSDLGAASPLHLGDYTYGQGAGPHAVTAVGGLSFDYDGAGQMIRRDDIALSWDAFGRMTGASRDDKQLSKITYGAGSNRLFKETDERKDWFLAEDYTIRDGVASIYIEAGDHNTARLDTAATGTLVLSDVVPDDQINAADAWIAHRAEQGDAQVEDADPSAHLLNAAVARMLTGPGFKTFQHADHRATTIATTGPNGRLIERTAHSPHGQERGEPMTSESRGYNSKERDEETGLISFGARYLDPVLGRWISPDPLFEKHESPQFIRVEEEVGAYVAMGNNPVRYHDPDGRFVAETAALIGMAASAVVGGVIGGIDSYRETKLYGEMMQVPITKSSLFGYTAVGVLSGAFFGFLSPLSLVKSSATGALVYATDGIIDKSASLEGLNKLTTRRVVRTLITGAISIGITITVAALVASPLAPFAIAGAGIFMALKLMYHAHQHKREGAAIEKRAAKVKKTLATHKKGSAALNTFAADGGLNNASAAITALADSNNQLRSGKEGVLGKLKRKFKNKFGKKKPTKTSKPAAK